MIELFEVAFVVFGQRMKKALNFGGRHARDGSGRCRHPVAATGRGSQSVALVLSRLVVARDRLSCALVISTPVSFVAALASAAHQGVLVKGAGYLEVASQLKAIALGKTGTLTVGRPEVKEIVALSGQVSFQTHPQN